MSKSKAVVLLSGGMDSCVATAIANETHSLAVLHASYGQRTERRERQAFDDIADFYSARERLVVQLNHLRMWRIIRRQFLSRTCHFGMPIFCLRQ